MPITTSDDILWGVAAIAAVIGRTKRATQYLLERDAIPAKKVQGRWVASKAKLIGALVGDEASAG